MARRLGVALVLAAFALVVAFLLMQDRGASRQNAREGAVPSQPAAPAVEARGPGGEEERNEPEPAPETATIRGTVSKEDGPAWCVRIFAVVGENTVVDTGTDPNGRYSVEIPADRDVVLELRPDPATGFMPARRTFLLSAGEEIVQDFTLEAPPSASGRVEGLALDESVILLAIRAEEFPALSDDPMLAATALEAAPRLRATASGGGVFRFRQLDPAATYRLAAEGIVWAVKDAVYFKGGDNAILARLHLVVPLSVEVTDLETGAAVPRFAVKLVDMRGEVRDTLEGRFGRAARWPLVDPPPGTEPRGYWRWRGEVTSFLGASRLVVNADGYHEQIAPRHETSVALQRVREPNVLLRIAYPDGAPYDGELMGRFGPALKAPLHVKREAPGRFLAALPAGKWQLHLARPGVFFDAEPVLDLVVPYEGTIEPALLVVERTGTVTFEGETDFTVQRAVEGQWHFRPGETGTFELPAGSYRVLRRDELVATFAVRPGGKDVVRVAKLR